MPHCSPQAREIYSSEYLCAKNVVWGKCGKVGICRCTKQTNCVDTPECPPGTLEEEPERQQQQRQGESKEGRSHKKANLVGALVGAEQR